MRCKTIIRQTGPCDDVSFTTAGVRIGFGLGRGLRCTALTRQKRIREKNSWHEFGKRERERGNGGADFGSPDLTRGASGTGPEILETKMPEMPDGRHGLGHAVRWAALTLMNSRQEFAKRFLTFFWNNCLSELHVWAHLSAAAYRMMPVLDGDTCRWHL